jgi:hypothetical protein
MRSTSNEKSPIGAPIHRDRAGGGDPIPAIVSKKIAETAGQLR